MIQLFHPFKNSEKVALKDAIGKVLSTTVRSKIDMPPFRQSAMDGYALHTHDSDTYTIIDEVKAGDTHMPELKAGEAVRIFTGAMVPDTANAVIMQEKTQRDDLTLTIEGELKEGANIRPLGEQIRENNIAMKEGEALTPAGISFLQGLGITEVDVVQSLTAVIVITGDELVPAGNELSKGKIYESNGVMLQTALSKAGIEDTEIIRVKDNYEATLDVLAKAIKENDLVLISGGISVGDYDFSGKALLELGVEQQFYKVKQKPGKPLFYGKKENSLIFSLPGNPAAALTCFYVYVLRAIHLTQGIGFPGLIRTQLPMTWAYQKKGDRAQFMKAKILSNGVELLSHQSSAMLRSMAEANALVYLPADKFVFDAKEMVDVFILPS